MAHRGPPKPLKIVFQQYHRTLTVNCDRAPGAEKSQERSLLVRQGLPRLEAHN